MKVTMEGPKKSGVISLGVSWFILGLLEETTPEWGLDIGEGYTGKYQLIGETTPRSIDASA